MTARYFDWVRQTVASAPGTGDATLSVAEASYIRLSDIAAVVNGTEVHYTFIDGTNREKGIGMWTTGNVFTRDKIFATNNGGVFTEYPSVGLTLTTNAVLTISSIAAMDDRPGIVALAKGQLSSWVSQTVPNDDTWNAIEWGGGSIALFAAVGVDGAGTGVMTSPDGRTWTDRTNPNTAIDWTDVAFDPIGEIFVAVGDAGTGNKTMNSTNGTTWSSVAAATAATWQSVVWADSLGLFVAVGDTGGVDRVMTSPDGTLWTARTEAVASAWSNIAWSEELGILVASRTGTTGNAFMTSTDGIAWTTRTSPADATYTIDQVAWSAELGIFLAMSASSSATLTSLDGITWTAASIMPATNFDRVIWAKELGLFVALGGGGAGADIAVSSDGLEWRVKEDANIGTPFDLAWSADLGIFAVTTDQVGTTRIMLSS